MHSFLPLLSTALLLGAGAFAQACPHTAARTVPQQITFHGTRECGSVEIRFGGVALTPPRSGCPLLVSYVPEHEVEEPSQSETRAEITGTEPTYLLSYKCERTMLWFVVLSSDCRLDRWFVSGKVYRRRTVPCGGGS